MSLFTLLLSCYFFFFRQGLQCTQCGYNVHTKCQSMVPAECPKHPSLSEQPANDMTRSSHSLQGVCIERIESQGLYSITITSG